MLTAGVALPEDRQVEVTSFATGVTVIVPEAHLPSGRTDAESKILQHVCGSLLRMRTEGDAMRYMEYIKNSLQRSCPSILCVADGALVSSSGVVGGRGDAYRAPMLTPSQPCYGQVAVQLTARYQSWQQAAQQLRLQGEVLLQLKQCQVKIWMSCVEQSAAVGYAAIVVAATCCQLLNQPACKLDLCIQGCCCLPNIVGYNVLRLLSLMCTAVCRENIQLHCPERTRLLPTSKHAVLRGSKQEGKLNSFIPKTCLISQQMQTSAAMPQLAQAAKEAGSQLQMSTPQAALP